MISGTRVRKIVKYLPIDHCGEGFCYVEPRDGEMFEGIPYSWYEDSGQPFIEVRDKDGVVVRSINCADISEIEFQID